MKPLQHAQISAHRYGGRWQDWIDIHGWIDSSKTLFASMQHRMLLHSDFGAWLAPLVFGEIITAGDASARTADLFADHQLEDLGRTYALSEWLREVRPDARPAPRRTPRGLEGVRDSAAAGLAERWGGEAADYAPLVAFFDKPRELAPEHAAAADLVTHSSFGIFLAEQLLGPAMTVRGKGGRSRLISTRSPAEDLVHARLGWIPTASALPAHTRLRLWMRGAGVRPALRERPARTREHATCPRRSTEG